MLEHQLLLKTTVSIFFWMCFFSPDINVIAQANNCCWLLTFETPREIRGSTAEGVAATGSGSTMTVECQGLSTTHYWAKTRGSFIPGDSPDMEVRRFLRYD